MRTKRKSKAKRKAKVIRRRSEDSTARRKYKRGRRIEAYTFGEALGSKRWP